ncbi:YggS family pyridoxal phosphate-dependent enzyme [Niabella yanshanensis]|uniref:Pyridoxal phosphate homeostasis protein n=1 Tax=Niabella yanshanensis TaxID=577386 RepID=A0ABZ0W4K1_9BACT|nr:YggS family pyridoxal phosphate-dependent enzyme [Niabella yanshanensis]WQD38152.1 YggS family pyridoxal phosphate-dependent enzyme [Niabella yanshanensis]
MSINVQACQQLITALRSQNVSLVAVSKIKPVSDIKALYDLGQRDFGENYVQELVDKQSQLPGDIRWHFIGHLQSNKAKYIAPFVHLIHGVDSFNLLKEINKQALKNNRVIDCLLQVHVAQEETKFGLDETELNDIMAHVAVLKNVQIKGLMGMASFSNDEVLVRNEFRQLKKLFEQLGQPGITNIKPEILSMGMSGDYTMAIEEGSTMVRVGSLLFGARA